MGMGTMNMDISALESGTDHEDNGLRTGEAVRVTQTRKSVQSPLTFLRRL